MTCRRGNARGQVPRLLAMVKLDRVVLESVESLVSPIPECQACPCPMTLKPNNVIGGAFGAAVVVALVLERLVCLGAMEIDRLRHVNSGGD
eukprot:CAMPEP_0206604026 /NCGR_PEP_ID=MMETSP0325_2-20121206/48987_1 /ASSEMBLY_ACC=CAM_ASM_000347 /TAXON_ID=2866 /ORGANISM="Crypthecodinium cohnii, Strain Seligo" /LENGTH=90 /DNA_ID=CAMNT_0054118125 /DNA_START=85 /DNA_END=358 /DNA_ORIENTATION=-